MRIGFTPSIILIKDFKSHYIYNMNEHFDEIKLLKFVEGGYKKETKKDFQKYKLFSTEAALKEQLKVEEFKEKIQHYEAEDYEDLTNVSEKNKLLMIYSPYCPHCHTFMPTMMGLQKKNKDSHLEFAAVDLPTGNRLYSTPFNIKAFPTIILMSGDSWYSFSGARDENFVYDFLRDF